MQWYYTENGESRGPVEEATLRQLAADGQLKPSAYVWNRTMGEGWVPATSVPGLFGANNDTEAASVAAIPNQHWGGPISCRAPVRPAWERMKAFLFRPFNLGTWFVLGFSAWLAKLGESGGTSFSGNLNDLRNPQRMSDPRHFDIRQVVEPIREFWSQHSDHIVMFGAALILLGFIFVLVITWLRARGKFIFLDNVIHKRALISDPWHEFAQHASSLFWWYVVYQLACLLVFAVLAGLIMISVVAPWVRAGVFVRSAIPSLAMIGVLWFVLAVILGYIARFVEDFIVPIAYRFDLTIMEAWGRFATLYKPQRGTFILYGLFYLWLRFLSGLCVLAFVAITCCMGGCLMAIPYVGAVVLLPVSVFFRAYSLEYLAQFGQEYRMFDEW